MPVTRDEVVFAYRFLLGREPESDEVVAEHQRARDWRELQRDFQNSVEAAQVLDRRSKAQGHTPIGRHLDVDSNLIDIRSTPQQLASMLDRVRTSWEGFGATEPYWSVLTNDVFRKDTLDDHLPGFFEHGRADVNQFLRFATRAGLPLRFERALDFGCGVGRLTLPLSDYADQVIGMDISAGHLAEARAVIDAAGVRNVELAHLRSVEEIPSFGSYDLVISRIVLQHNPPPIMAAIYEKLLQCLRTGGIAIVQMPTLIRDRAFSSDAYLTSAVEPMEMNALPQKDIFRIIAQQGCIPVEVREDADLGVFDGLSHIFAVVRP